ncbi:LysM peptidoglycan-binding domain-containing protein [Agromyces sp. MMS24-K17]|uniref:LysM peptidoglycan-binding domain-containing protein n=1 Tax=Agromyces sp. MMS24-K17 TaxID=3372850 RepID=UPI003754D9C9
MTLGIGQPAEASPQPPKRETAKPKATTTPVARPAAIEAAPSEYVVVAGDTVSGIAERYGLATAEVLARNGLSWSTLIFPGQRLQLQGGAEPHVAPVTPAIPRHMVVDGDTVSGIAARYGLSVDDVLSVNGLSRQSMIFPGSSSCCRRHRASRRRRRRSRSRRHQWRRPRRRHRRSRHPPRPPPHRSRHPSRCR